MAVPNIPMSMSWQDAEETELADAVGKVKVEDEDDKSSQT